MWRRARGVEWGPAIARRLGMAHREAPVDADRAENAGRHASCDDRRHASQASSAILVRRHARSDRAPRCLRRRRQHGSYRRRRRRQRQPPRLSNRRSPTRCDVLAAGHGDVLVRIELLADDVLLQQRRVVRGDWQPARPHLPDGAAERRVHVPPAQLFLHVPEGRVQRHPAVRAGRVLERAVDRIDLDVQSAAARRGNVSGCERRRRERRRESHGLSAMRSKRSLRASFVITIGAASALVGACGGVTNAGPTDGGSINPAGCPELVPTSGAACTGSESCSYESKCGGMSATCVQAWRDSGRTWSVTETRPSDTGCPSTMPVSGSPCDECHLPTTSCSYTTAVDCFGMPLGASVSCYNGKWNVSISSCNPPPPPRDAGSETSTFDASSGDASADANHTD